MATDTQRCTLCHALNGHSLTLATDSSRDSALVLDSMASMLPTWPSKPLPTFGITQQWLVGFNGWVGLGGFDLQYDLRGERASLTTVKRHAHHLVLWH
jgi:hypothetical protein